VQSRVNRPLGEIEDSVTALPQNLDERIPVSRRWLDGSENQKIEMSPEWLAVHT
jgi:hypothetical protein